MDKQIYLRAGFLLSQIENESHMDIFEKAIYFIQAL